MRFLCFSLLLLIALSSCTESQPTLNSTYEPVSTSQIIIHPDSIKIEGNLGAFTKTVKTENPAKGLQLITFNFSAETASELPKLTLSFAFPSIDINGFWNPTSAVDKVNYYRSGLKSKASQWAPVLGFYNNQSKNRLTFALSDALNRIDIDSYLKEEDVKFYPSIHLFNEKMPVTTSYSITLRIDTRDLPYYEAIEDVADWWAKMDNYTPLNVPDVAKKPMYSTWYSYHQSITAKDIVKECKIAKSLGCDAVIVDDGWQTLDGNRGYAYTGDWNPDRIPDMKGFVDSVHAVGMNFLLWYSLPFVGEKAKTYPRFKGKYLRYWESQGTYVLDPRYPEVREFIIQTYETALKNWNLDGFKLDFIGWFTALKDTRLTKENGRDFASVNEATNHLMTEIMKRLKSMKADIMIEFRQPYIGPLMRRYGNMFRGTDCPNNAVANRLETTNLRLMAGNTAVHSDMFIWRPEEKVETAALQILNILYSVPQLSVRLEEIPEKHLDMIRFWFDYWNQHRETLLDGQFIPSSPTANYSQLTAIGNSEQITTVYEKEVITLTSNNLNSIDLINATGHTQLVIQATTNLGTYNAVIVNCQGKEVERFSKTLSSGLHLINIPPSGMVNLRKE